MSINRKRYIMRKYLLVIERAIKMEIQQRNNKDILLLIDSMSAVKKLRYNRLNTYESKYILNIRENICEYRNKWKEKKRKREQS